MSGPEGAPVAVVAAMREELGALLARARDARRDAHGFHLARLGNVPVVLAATGEGARRARRGLAALCDAHRPGAVVGMGVAGALTQELSVFDILVARRVLGEGAEAPPPDAAMASRALAIPGAREATFLTVAAPVVSRAARGALAASVDGDGAPVAVDMESAAWAREASERRIPYALLRVVNDGADDELPRYLSRCMDAEGGIRRSRVALAALADPASIPALLMLRRRVREASGRLAAFVEHYLNTSL
jgi:adenosylhomocysteine nucleosidase